MSVYFLFFLLLLTLLLSLLKRRRLSLLLLVLGIFWLVSNGTGLLSRLLLSPLQDYPQLNNHSWKERNAIVLLAAGTYRWQKEEVFTTHPLGLARVLEALRQYRLCRKTSSHCKIIPSGRDVQRLGVTEARIMQKELESLGVPPEDILPEENSANTFENAKYSSELIKRHGFDQVILVTSGFHMLRSLVLFKHFDLHPTPAPSENLNPRFILLPRGSNIYWSDLALHEYGGLAKFYVFNFMNWDY